MSELQRVAQEAPPYLADPDTGRTLAGRYLREQIENG
jgi:hypothetical protein